MSLKMMVLIKGGDVWTMILNLILSKLIKKLERYGMNEREKEFVKGVKDVIRKSKCLSQTQILLALGINKDDKWARRTLSEFEGVFW